MIDIHYVVWCDSVQGLISIRVYENNQPVMFNASLLPDTVVQAGSEHELYDILRKRDGTKVSFPCSLAYEYLGWEV